MNSPSSGLASDNTTLFNKSSKDAYQLSIQGAAHEAFTDSVAWIVNPVAATRRRAQAMNACLVSFFNKHLMGVDDQLLENPGATYPTSSLSARSELESSSLACFGGDSRRSPDPGKRRGIANGTITIPNGKTYGKKILSAFLSTPAQMRFHTSDLLHDILADVLHARTAQYLENLRRAKGVDDRHSHRLAKIELSVARP